MQINIFLILLFNKKLSGCFVGYRNRANSYDNDNDDWSVPGLLTIHLYICIYMYIYTYINIYMDSSVSIGIRVNTSTIRKSNNS